MNAGAREVPGALELWRLRRHDHGLGREHFPTAFEEAAALAESVVRRHPFVDGNKRTGVSAGAYPLSSFGCELTATNEALDELAVSAAIGALGLEQVARWFEKCSRQA